MTALRLWHLWPSRQWPSSAAEEAALIADLRAAAAALELRYPGRLLDDVGRHDTTAVLNALRSGLGGAQLLAQIPGAEPANLVRAYEVLSLRLSQTRGAWLAIATNPTWAVVEANAASAAVLMPIPVPRILTAAAHTQGKSLASATAEVVNVVAQHARVVARIEQELATCTPGGSRGPALGARLHNPLNPGLWGSPFFLPDRVTALSSPRVADLLGERTGADDPLE